MLTIEGFTQTKDYAIIEEAFLNKGITLIITDKRELEENGNGDNYRSEKFFSEEGLKEFVQLLDATREKLNDNTICI